MKKYNSLNKYLRDKYGQKIYKISIDGGFTCPNRDGTIGSRGCIFCSGYGSGDFAENSSLSITEQIENGKAKVASKMSGNKYIAYFQAFTNTYGDIDRLRSLYMETVNHEKTAEYIRRGYPLSVYDEAVKNLRNIDIEVITHVIIGLPGESKEDILQTVKYVGESGVQGIKLQLLHVIKGTDMETDYLAGKFSCMSMEEYTDIIIECLKVLPDDIIIHRMTGDGAKKTLIAPLWSADKKKVLNYMNKRMRDEKLL